MIFFTKVFLFFTTIIFCISNVSFANCYFILKENKTQMGQRNIELKLLQSKGKGCTPSDFINIYNALPSEARRDFKNFVVETFKNDDVELRRTYEFNDLPNPSGEPNRYEILSVGNNPSQNYNDDDFEELFDTKYDTDKIKNNRTVTLERPSFLSEESKKQICTAGASIFSVLSSGVLSDLKNDLKLSWDVVIKGKDLPDHIAAEDRLAYMTSILNDFHNFREHAIKKHLDILSENDKLLHEINISYSKYTDSSRQTKNIKKLKSLKENIEKGSNSLRYYYENTSPPKREASYIPITGRLDSDGQEKFKNLLQKNITTLKGIVSLNNVIHGEVELDENEQSFLNDLQTQEGLLLTLTTMPKNKILSDFKFHLDRNTAAGKEIRKAFNEALFFNLNPNLNNEVNYIVSELKKADFYLANSSGYNRILGNRSYQRGRILLDYLENNNRSHSFKNYKQNMQSELFFGHKISSDSYRGYELNKLSNTLLSDSNYKNNEYFRFHTDIILAQTNDKIQNSNDFDGFSKIIDYGWAIHDYSKGFITGIGESIYDFANGINQLVLHPIDSYNAMAYSLWHYDKTYDHIKKEFLNFVSEYPNYSLQEKAKFQGKLFANVASILLGGEFSRSGELAQNLEKASNSIINRFSKNYKNISTNTNELKIYTSLLGKNGPLHDLPLGNKLVADTFRSGTYYEYELNKPLTLYRVYSSPDEFALKSSFWTKTKPTGPVQSIIDYALEPTWGNKATKWVEIEVPRGTKIYEGVAAPILKSDETISQLTGGGNQIYLNFSEINININGTKNVITEIPKKWVKDKGAF